MFDLIVVGHEGGGEGDDALAFASELTAACGSRLLVARVGKLPRADPIALPDSTELVTLDDQEPAAALADLAASRGADLVVVGSSHRAEPALTFFGSTAENLVHDGRTPVAVTPKGLRHADDLRVRVVGAAIDGSATSERALSAAGELASACSATMRIFHVRSAGGPPGAARSRDLTSDATERVPASTRPAGEELEGFASIAIAQELEKGVDVLLVGSSARGRLGRAVLGGVSVDLMRSALCPVIAFPAAS